MPCWRQPRWTLTRNSTKSFVERSIGIVAHRAYWSHFNQRSMNTQISTIRVIERRCWWRRSRVWIYAISRYISIDREKPGVRYSVFIFLECIVGLYVIRRRIDRIAFGRIFSKRQLIAAIWSYFRWNETCHCSYRVSRNFARLEINWTTPIGSTEIYTSRICSMIFIIENWKWLIHAAICVVIYSTI